MYSYHMSCGISLLRVAVYLHATFLYAVYTVHVMSCRLSYMVHVYHRTLVWVKWLGYIAPVSFHRFHVVYIAPHFSLQ